MGFELVVDREFGLLRIESVECCYRGEKLTAARPAVGTDDQNMLEVYLLIIQYA